MFDMKRKFILFLKKRGAYASYRKNISYPEIRNDIKKGEISSVIIGMSFPWEKTKEGVGFWNNLSAQWFFLCDEY